MDHFWQNIPGWFDFQDFYSNEVNLANHTAHFVEVGAWLGRSASYMAVEIANSGKNIKFDVIDNWEIGPESGYRQTLATNTSPYESFLENIKSVSEYINPIKMKSIDAAKLYEDESLDFVFIDADHNYNSVKADILAWYPKVKKNGHMGGHNYTTHSSAKSAVHDCLGGNNISSIHTSWLYIKKDKKSYDINTSSSGVATVYAVAYNEEVRLSYFIKHYRSKLPNCEIVIFDNQSTDKTPKIALDNNCKIVSFGTNDQIMDDNLKKIKNYCWQQWHHSNHPWECWHQWGWTQENEKLYLEKYPDVKAAVEKGEFNCGMTHFFNHGMAENRVVPNRNCISDLSCQTDWCIVVDVDELLDVDENLLKNADFNIVNATLFDMYGEDYNIDAMDRGVKIGPKVLCWKNKDFNSINYEEGSHICNPQPVYGKNIIFNVNQINGYHIKWVDVNYVIERCKVFAVRNRDNIKKGWGVQNHFPDAQQLAYYNLLKLNAVKVR